MMISAALCRHEKNAARKKKEQLSAA